MTKVTIQGKEVEFTPNRVMLATRQEDKHYYCLRHGDDWGIPLTVENNVLCNFYGTIVSDESLELDCKDGAGSYYELTEEEKDMFLQM